MKFESYYIGNSAGKSNCVVRSFCKLFNEEYDTVYDELSSIAKDLNCNYNDIESFEKYMSNHNTFKIDYGADLKIRDLNLDYGGYIVLCWDKKDFYHMISIIDNTIYDKDNSCLELYVISIYKKET